MKTIIITGNQPHRLKAYTSLNSYLSHLKSRDISNLTEVQKTIRELKKIPDNFDRYITVNYQSGFRDEVRIQKITII